MSTAKKLVRKAVRGPLLKLVETGFRNGRGLLWQIRYGFPAKGQRVIGITGTNGKTTTASYVNAMLQTNGYKTAVYTTAFIEIDGQRQPNRTHMTVSSQHDVQAFFSQAKKAEVDFVIMEITSHALDQGRLNGVKVEVAAITNLTQEHLDYHGTMENYAAAKARLLSGPYNPQWCILNADDRWFNFFKERSSGRVLAFGESKRAELKLTHFDLTAKGSAFTLRYKDKPAAVNSQLIGKFNAYNAMAAFGIGLALGIEPADISKGIASLKAVPGRMESVDAGQPFSVIVDYAITPDALQNVLTALKEVTKGKVHIVFGATGDRDKTKRAPMGKTVGQLADRIYLTDDETYSEDPATIRAEVYSGIKAVKAERRTTEFNDRRDAIKAAFKAAKPGDTVLLTGIGHQDYRQMGNEKQPWDEREVAREELNTLK